MHHAQSTPPAIGAIIKGTYKVQKFLGRGGMGAVMAIERLSDGVVFAAKFCMELDPTAVRRFEREVRAMQSLAHPHVMPVLDVDLQHSPPFFVMPRAKGSLADEDFKGKESECLDAFIGVLDGIQAIHTSGGTHRDIKPANALRLPDGRVVVSDLGLIKLDPRDSTILTQTMQFLGTRKYCAPEQLLPAGSREADARTDVFQLGKLFYELLTGRDAALIDTTGLPDGVSHLIRRATRENPAERYQSVGEFRDAVTAYREAKKPGARPVQTFENLKQQIAELLGRNEYRAEMLRALCALIAHLEQDSDKLAIDFVVQIEDVVLQVMSKDLVQDFVPALRRFEQAVDRAVGGYTFSFAELVAAKMKVVFKAAALSEARALALLATMHAAVGLNRFAAMEEFDKMLCAVTKDDDAMAIQEGLQANLSEFANLAGRYSAEQLHPLIRTVWAMAKPTA